MEVLEPFTIDHVMPAKAANWNYDVEKCPVHLIVIATVNQEARISDCETLIYMWVSIFHLSEIH